MRARFILDLSRVPRRTLVHRLPSGKIVGRQGGTTGFISHKRISNTAQTKIFTNKPGSNTGASSVHVRAHAEQVAGARGLANGLRGVECDGAGPSGVARAHIQPGRVPNPPSCAWRCTMIPYPHTNFLYHLCMLLFCWAGTHIRSFLKRLSDEY